VYETYSPYIWGTMELEPKPIQKKGWAQWVFFFFVGFGATFAGYFGHRFVRNYQLKLLKAKSEEERYEFETLKLAIEKKVILKDFNLEEAAHDTHITSVRINNILKRYAGMPFHDYLMFCRIEIAKERLRSSHLGEDVIAETTGFANKAEMEKFFLKFHHITPYKFRVEQQVA
jgi:YesN/AraC family two-component response regulator